MKIGNMAQVSLRPVHLIRWIVILLIAGSIVFWYFNRLKTQQDLAERAADQRSFTMPQPSLKVNEGPEFVLDGKKLRILSGSVHYFRVVPEYWEDRLLKMKACGLNTLTVYVPWNKHEEVRGDFDFSGILDLEKFLGVAKKVGLYVILRPGPYICSEWDFGGLPSWLLQYDEMQVRSTYPLYLGAVDRYFEELIPKVAKFQYSKGGPIIAVQVENEYGSYGDDKSYLMHLKETLQRNGIVELLVTSDNSKQHLIDGSVDGVFMTANFQAHAANHMSFLKELQGADKPLMVMEFWSGWFDHWGEGHHVLDLEATKSNKGFTGYLKDVLDHSASVNFYMFHGGTNFGFMAGANLGWKNKEYQPDVTSYDYDAPISEAGDVTDKFFKISELLKSHTPKGTVPDHLPKLPTQIGHMAYPTAKVTHYMTLDDMLVLVGTPIKHETPLHMEKLPINQNGGQGYGFLLYRTTVKQKPGKLLLSKPPQDRAQVFLNGQEVGLLERINDNEQRGLEINNGRDGDNILELLVENMARVNYGKFMNGEKKGLLGDVLIDGRKQLNWEMYPMEFKVPFLQAVSSSTKWKDYASEVKRPALYKATLEVTDKKPKDTFLDMREWDKGVIFVNGFNLGRYWKKGPQLTYYLPGPLLKTGTNEIIIFELHQSSSELKFSEKPNLGLPQPVTNDDDDE